MTNRQRLLDAMQRKSVKGNVFGTGTSIICQDIMDLCNTYFPEGHTNAEKMFKLALTGHAILGLDMVMPLFSVCHEAGAMGCNVNWGSPDIMPESGKPIFKDVDDISIPDNLLTHPSCKVPLEALTMLKKELSDEAAVCGKVFGSWTQAYHYFGVENFLMLSITESDKTHEILERLLPVTINFGKAQIEAGADCLLLADHATSDLCSPQAYDKFLKEMHGRICEQLDVPIALHICGNTMDRIAMIAESGVDCFHWDTKSGEPEQVRKAAGDKLSLKGGISNYLLLRGTPDEVANAARKASTADIDIIGPECAIPLTTPLENLKAIASIGR
jgi:[methyl-Co(III) methanol-specific corrinoid protein]:coenzyme M methyltransferase